jgi:hypothetical protein
VTRIVHCAAPQARLTRQGILKLALIGFVFHEPPDWQVFISLSTISVYTHSAFSEIGFVLHNLVKTVVAVLPLTTDSSDEHGLGECVYAVSHLPIFSSTHLLTKRRLTFQFSLLTSNSRVFNLFVRYILYPITSLPSREFAIKSPWPYLAECEP